MVKNNVSGVLKMNKYFKNGFMSFVFCLEFCFVVNPVLSTQNFVSRKLVSVKILTF